MKKINKYIYIMVAALAFLFTACDEDDNTGASGLVPTNPTISVDVPSGGVNLLEAKTTYLFDVSISDVQIADISIYISAIAGTATLGDDFTIDNGNSRVYIPAGKTTGTVSITVLEDELLEETETFTIQIGDERTANAVLTPVTVDFTLTNLTVDDLAIGLSWETDVVDAIGLELDADEAVDLRLLLIDVAADTIYAIENGESFEELLIGEDVPDGEYLLKVDIASTINAGDFNSAINIDLMLQFDQVGVINSHILSFPQALTNEFTCSTYQIELATITKSGGSFTIDEAYAIPFSPYAGDWLGTDSGYDSQVSFSLGCDLNVFGLNHAWMEDFWGEEVVKEELVAITIDETAGTVEILEQDYITTLYDGDEYPYTIKGTGTYDNSGEFAMMTIVYEVFQDGFSPSQWAAASGYQDDPFFTAVLTMDPAGLPTAPTSVRTSRLVSKPIH